MHSCTPPCSRRATRCVSRPHHRHLQNATVLTRARCCLSTRRMAQLSRALPHTPDPVCINSRPQPFRRVPPTSSPPPFARHSGNAHVSTPVSTTLVPLPQLLPLRDHGRRVGQPLFFQYSDDSANTRTRAPGLRHLGLPAVLPGHAGAEGLTARHAASFSHVSQPVCWGGQHGPSTSEIAE